MKNWLKNNCLDFIAKEMWHLNSLQLNPLEYHVWGTVRGLSQAPPTPNMVGELKEMLQVTAYKSGSDRKKTAKKLRKPVLPKDGYFIVYSNNCSVVLLYYFSFKDVILL